MMDSRLSQSLADRSRRRLSQIRDTTIIPILQEADSKTTNKFKASQGYIQGPV